MSVLKVRGIRHDAASTDAINLDSSGNVGVGTASPISNSGYGGLTLNGTSGSLFSLMTNGTESGRIASLGNETSIQCKASTGYISFVQGVSGGTERMRIDASGRVTMPYQPTAHLVNTSDISGTGRITTWTARINVGNHYSSGIFTCPVAGVYLINAMVWRNSNTVDYAVRQNSVNKARIRQSSVNDCGYSGAIILNCAANDTIDFFIIDNPANNLYGGSGYSETLTSAVITLLG